MRSRLTSGGRAFGRESTRFPAQSCVAGLEHPLARCRESSSLDARLAIDDGSIAERIGDALGKAPPVVPGRSTANI